MAFIYVNIHFLHVLMHNQCIIFTGDGILNIVVLRNEFAPIIAFVAIYCVVTSNGRATAAAGGS